MHHLFCQVLVVLLLLNAPNAVVGQEVTESDGSTAEIEAAVRSYVAAFNARNVDKLLSHWSPEGVYTSRATGEQIVGRDAMAEEFAALFANEDAPTLAVATQSIEFISPNVALERGTATTSRGEDDVVESNYSVVYVQQDGAWLIDRVTEDEIPIQFSSYEHLQDLEWLIGEWLDEGQGFAIEIDCQWTRNQNFISRKYKILGENEIESSGLQIIGWDPQQKQIRSWLFDSNGAVVTGTWTKRDDRWIVSSVATLADGGRGSFTSIFRPLQDGNYTWQKINQAIDGALLPNIQETTVRRK